MAAYTTAELDAIIAGLETKLTTPVEVRHGDKSIRNQSESEIRSSIAYFQAQYNDASDAPAVAPVKIRNFFGFGSKGFGF